MNAAFYCLAYQTLVSKDKEVSDFHKEKTVLVYLLPAIVLATFAIEIALKSKIQIQDCGKDEKSPKSHNLFKLFSKLNLSSREEIVMKTNEFYIYKTKLFDSEDYIDFESFDKLIKSNSNQFENVRYIHEPMIFEKIELDFIEALMFSLILELEDYKRFLKKISDKKPQNKEWWQQ